MLSKITIKRAIKWSAGRAAAALNTFKLPGIEMSACIFTYHRVADISFLDPSTDDWNVPAARLQEHISAICEIAEIIPLPSLPQVLREPMRARPFACLTFDDGYANFFTNVVPVLQRHGVPATVFVVTGSIGKDGPVVFDSWSQKNASRVPPEISRALTWDELECCLKTGLVTVGSHSHEHKNALHCSAAQLREEAERSRAEIHAHLGAQHAEMYAFPYGSMRLGQVNREYIDAVRNAGYTMAFTTDPGIVHPGCDPHCLPRVEAHTLDSRSAIHAKLRGTLLPYQLTDRFRSAERGLPSPVRMSRV